MLITYEENGRYYVTDGTNTIEVDRYIDEMEVEYDEAIGYTYEGRLISEYQI